MHGQGSGRDPLEHRGVGSALAFFTEQGDITQAMVDEPERVVDVREMDVGEIEIGRGIYDVGIARD